MYDVKSIGKYFKEIEDFNYDLIAYLHIPKASGNTVISFLNKDDSKHYRVKWNDIKGTWKEFVETKDLSKYKLVSGHYTWNELVQLQKRKDVNSFNITFVRHPIERLVSQYRYMTTPKHPLYKTFVKNNPNFDVWALRKARRNAISHALAPKSIRDSDIYTNVLKNFHFIGMQDYFNTSMNILSDITDFKFKAGVVKNKTIKNSVNDFEISHATYEKLKVKHQADIALYEKLKNYYPYFIEEYFKYKSRS